MIPAVITGVVLLICIVPVVKCYNTLISLRNRTDNQKSQIDIQLKRKADLIPALVDITKEYAGYESEVLQNVVRLRAGVVDGNNTTEAVAADGKLNKAMKQFWAVCERYPELKANKNYMQLSEELTGTEDKITKARQFYNDTATRYNTEIMTFPKSIVAAVFKFRRIDLFLI